MSRSALTAQCGRARRTRRRRRVGDSRRGPATGVGPSWVSLVRAGWSSWNVTSRIAKCPQSRMHRRGCIGFLGGSLAGGRGRGGPRGCPKMFPYADSVTRAAARRDSATSSPEGTQLKEWRKGRSRTVGVRPRGQRRHDHRCSKREPVCLHAQPHRGRAGAKANHKKGSGPQTEGDDGSAPRGGRRGHHRVEAFRRR